MLQESRVQLETIVDIITAEEMADIMGEVMTVAVVTAVATAVVTAVGDVEAAVDVEEAGAVKCGPSYSAASI